MNKHTVTQNNESNNSLDFIDRLTARATILLAVFFVVYFGVHITIAIISGRF